MASSQAPRKLREPKAKAENDEGTTYVVLRRHDDGSYSEFARTSARQGVLAIKAATRRADGTHHEPGSFKAVPATTWDSETNALDIVTETKLVSSFATPNGAPKATVSVP